MKNTEPLYEKTRRDLLMLIEEEHINYLPNENELMSRFNVSRNTLRRAILELTKENVLQPIKGLGTKVYPSQGMVAGSTILILCDEFQQEFQTEIFMKLYKYLSDADLNIKLLAVDHDNIDSNKIINHFKNVDAIIFDMNCSFSAKLRELAIASGKKRVCLRWDATRYGLASIIADITRGTYLLMTHLLNLGHRKIVVITVPNVDIKRNEGIVKACKDLSLDENVFKYVHMPEKAMNQDNWRRGYDSTDELLKSGEKFTAIMVHNDAMALGVQIRLLQAGIKIPEDVSIVGFDNLESSANYPVPLTTCSGNQMDMIQGAISYLFSMKRPDERFCKIYSPELVIRESTGKPQK